MRFSFSGNNGQHRDYIVSGVVFVNQNSVAVALSATHFQVWQVKVLHHLYEIKVPVV